MMSSKGSFKGHYTLKTQQSVELPNETIHHKTTSQFLHQSRDNLQSPPIDFSNLPVNIFPQNSTYQTLNFRHMGVNTCEVFQKCHIYWHKSCLQSTKDTLSPLFPAASSSSSVHSEESESSVKSSLSTSVEYQQTWPSGSSKCQSITPPSLTILSTTKPDGEIDMDGSQP